jgi:hypothetical protein
MSDRNTGTGDNYFPEDPFAPEVVEDTIAASGRRDAPATPSLVLVGRLADAYALPPAADAVLARSRATLARRAEALGRGTLQTEGERATSPASRPVATPVPGWLEYALIAFLCFIVVVAALILLGPQVATIFNNVNEAI